MSVFVLPYFRVGDTLVHRVSLHPYYHTKIETPPTPTSPPPSKPNQLLQKHGYTDYFCYLAKTTHPRLCFLFSLWSDAQPTYSICCRYQQNFSSPLLLWNVEKLAAATPEASTY